VTQLRTNGVNCRESAGTGLVNLKCRGPNPSEPGVDATTGNAMVPSCCCDCEQAATEFGRNRDAGAEAEVRRQDPYRG
ncbi:unnamed protein product, partial [Ascophyllum nodosum]